MQLTDPVIKGIRSTGRTTYYWNSSFKQIGRSLGRCPEEVSLFEAREAAKDIAAQIRINGQVTGDEYVSFEDLAREFLRIWPKAAKKGTNSNSA